MGRCRPEAAAGEVGRHAPRPCIIRGFVGKPNRPRLPRVGFLFRCYSDPYWWTRPAGTSRPNWSYRLVVPANITIVPLPPKCPELNPVKNVWQFIRNNWLSNQVFASYDAIVDHCCDAWNRLADQPWRVMTIGLRDWATGHATWILVLTSTRGRSPTPAREILASVSKHAT